MVINCHTWPEIVINGVSPQLYIERANIYFIVSRTVKQTATGGRIE